MSLGTTVLQLFCFLHAATSLEPAVIPTAQASSFTLHYFRVMHDVPSVAAVCSESTTYFPVMASECFYKPCFTIPVATIAHFMFYIRCVNLVSPFIFFSDSSGVTLLSASTAIPSFVLEHYI